MIESNHNYYINQNREQRQTIDEQEETIKLLKKSEYETKQSIYNELIEIKKIGQSNDIHKNIKMLEIVEKLINDLYYDIQEQIEEDLEIEYKKELSSDCESIR